MVQWWAVCFLVKCSTAETQPQLLNGGFKEMILPLSHTPSPSPGDSRQVLYHEAMPIDPYWWILVRCFTTEPQALTGGF